MSKQKKSEKRLPNSSSSQNLEWEEVAKTRLVEWGRAKQNHMQWLAQEAALKNGHFEVTLHDISQAIDNWEKQQSEKTYTFGVLVKQKTVIAKLRNELRKLRKTKVE